MNQIHGDTAEGFGAIADAFARNFDEAGEVGAVHAAAKLLVAGELSVQTGLSLKQASPHPLTFVAGVTNGYIYYTPTAKQLENRGGAQEDSDCLLAPEWQELYENKAVEILQKL